SSIFYPHLHFSTPFFSRYSNHRDLHSFPTRRSSDLIDPEQVNPLIVRSLDSGSVQRFFWSQVKGDRGEPDHEGTRLRHLHSSCQDRKSTRLNSSHVKISYAVFCLKKKIKR